MQFLNENMNKAIRDLVVEANPAVLAIRAQQNAPIPNASPFATVQLALRPPGGWAERIQANNPVEDIDETICQRVLLRASVNYFRNDGTYSGGMTLSAMDAAVDFSLYLQGSKAWETMDAAGIGLNNVSEVRNLTAIENDEWEERAQLDVDFNVVATRTDLIYEIKSVLITGEYQEHTNIYPLSFTVDENSGPI